MIQREIKKENKILNEIKNLFENKNMEQIDIQEIIFSTKSQNCILLNGDKKSSAQYNLQNLIDFENDKSIDHVKVSVPYAIIPNSMYNINDNNNKLIILTNVTTTYTFPNGNYNYNTFISQFNTLFSATSFTISFNSLTNKFTLSNSSTNFSLLSQSTIDYIMGFSGTISSTTGSAPYTLTLTRSCNFLPLPIINICCDQISNCQTLGNNSNPLFSNILASVPNISKIGNQIIYQNVEDEFILNNLSQNIITLNYLDDAGNFIDFNGLSTWVLLRFKIYKKYKVIEGTFNDFLKGSTQLRNNNIEDE
jgi:hypothetical protein